MNETQVILVSVIGVIVFLLALIGCGVSFAVLKRKRNKEQENRGKPPKIFMRQIIDFLSYVCISNKERMNEKGGSDKINCDLGKATYK